MFVYCRKCGWNQDDFWSDNYNPLKSLMDWKEMLLDPMQDLDRLLMSCEDEDGPMTFREAIARACEAAANKVRDMEWRTMADLESANPDHMCPKCGEELSID